MSQESGEYVDRPEGAAGDSDDKFEEKAEVDPNVVFNINLSSIGEECGDSFVTADDLTIGESYIHQDSEGTPKSKLAPDEFGETFVLEENGSLGESFSKSATVVTPSNKVSISIKEFVDSVLSEGDVRLREFKPTSVGTPDEFGASFLSEGETPPSLDIMKSDADGGAPNSIRSSAKTRLSKRRRKNRKRRELKLRAAVLNEESGAENLSDAEIHSGTETLSGTETETLSGTENQVCLNTVSPNSRESVENVENNVEGASSDTSDAEQLEGRVERFEVEQSNNVVFNINLSTIVEECGDRLAEDMTDGESFMKLDSDVTPSQSQLPTDEIGEALALEEDVRLWETYAKPATVGTPNNESIQEFVDSVISDADIPVWEALIKPATVGTPCNISTQEFGVSLISEGEVHSLDLKPEGAVNDCKLASSTEVFDKTFVLEEDVCLVESFTTPTDTPNNQSTHELAGSILSGGDVPVWEAFIKPAAVDTPNISTQESGINFLSERAAPTLDLNSNVTQMSETDNQSDEESGQEGFKKLDVTTTKDSSALEDAQEGGCNCAQMCIVM